MPETTKTPDRRCSGCSRSCDLSRPGCRWGEWFADAGAQSPRESGAFPERQDHHGERRGMRGPILASPRYQEAALPEKAELLLRELSMPRRGARDSQDRVLFLLAREEHMTQRDLTARLGIQPGSASELIGKLEAAGLIVRRPSETDRRTQDVGLTDLGRSRLSALSEAHRSARERRFDVLSEEELQQLCALLEKLCGDQKQE